MDIGEYIKMKDMLNVIGGERRIKLKGGKRKRWLQG